MSVQTDRFRSDEVKRRYSGCDAELKYSKSKAGMLGYRALIIDPEQMFKNKAIVVKTGGS